MFRVLFAIFIYIFAAIIRNGGRSRYSDYGSSIPGMGGNNGAYIDISDFITSKIRSFMAFRKAKKYLSKYSGSYSLKNRNVTLIYNYQSHSIACMNIKNRQENFKVYFEDYKDNNNYHYISDSILKNTFRELFNKICIFFNDDTSFENIFNFISEDYVINAAFYKKEKLDKNDISRYSNSQEKDMRTVDEYFSGSTDITRNFIDINNASLEEISSLPGINIILAKRIVKYRNENGGFKTKEELYNEFKIKSHFQKQLNKIIVIGNISSKSQKFDELWQYNDDDEDTKTTKTDDIVIDSLETEPPKNNKDRIIDI